MILCIILPLFIGDGYVSMGMATQKACWRKKLAIREDVGTLCKCKGNLYPPQKTRLAANNAQKYMKISDIQACEMKKRGVELFFR
jgi:hypothetical protein